MMVVHEDNERPEQVAVIRKPHLEQTSYVIVKNHVRELPNTAQNTSSIKINEDKYQESSENEDSKKKKRKSDKRSKIKKPDEKPTASIESDFITSSSSQIDSNDLEELKTVYMKCKEVMNKIETKYGHLLDLDSEEGPSSRCLKRKAHSESTEDECQCRLNKKIVFDDDGSQVIVDSPSEKHMCVKKIKWASSEFQTRTENISIENQDTDTVLPDTLNVLGDMLRDQTLEKTYQNNILEKMRQLRQEYANEIKFNKHILIEKLKSNPDEVLNFKGTNLSTLPGYS